MSSPQATHASLPKLPVALTLPDETWVQILLELDYCHLKKASRISKKLQRLTQDSKFDRVLYRAGPPQVPTARGATIKPHPIINEIDGIFLSLESAKMLESAKSSHTYHPASYPTVLDEFATRPASTTIAIALPIRSTSDLYKAKGVTVRDFLQHLAEYWITSRKGNAIMSRRSQKVIDVAMHLDPLVRRSLWTKWDFVQAQGGNETLFMADSFK